jgi:hypothetical protein
VGEAHRGRPQNGFRSVPQDGAAPPSPSGEGWVGCRAERARLMPGRSRVADAQDGAGAPYPTLPSPEGREVRPTRRGTPHHSVGLTCRCARASAEAPSSADRSPGRGGRGTAR